MRFNLNINLESVEDLIKVTNAFKEAATLQAQLRLQESIKELKAEKIALSTVVQALRDEQRTLKKLKDPEKGELKKLSEAGGLEVEEAPSEAASGLDEQADRIIERVDETNPNEAEARQR
jgi:predicted transcriptional regulator